MQKDALYRAAKQDLLPVGPSSLLHHINRRNNLPCTGQRKHRNYRQTETKPIPGRYFPSTSRTVSRLGLRIFNMSAQLVQLEEEKKQYQEQVRMPIQPNPLPSLYASLTDCALLVGYCPPIPQR